VVRHNTLPAKLRHRPVPYNHDTNSNMGRTPREPASSTKPRRQRKAKQSVDTTSESASAACTGNLDVAALKEASAKNRQDFCKSKRTREAYQGHVTRGKEFLASCIANEHSVDALELFLSQKCFKDGCGFSTAEAIHAAFADFCSRFLQGMGNDMPAHTSITRVPKLGMAALHVHR